MITYGKGPRRVTAPGQPISYTANSYAKPRPLTMPAISGSGTVGAAQSRLPGTWTGTPTVTWAWFLDGQEVQQGGTYTPVTADKGKTLTLLERATNASGGASARSAGVVIP